MNNRTLEDYVHDYINGNREVFDIIYQETSKAVYIAIRSIISNEAVVEDLMQDTYMKAINSLSSYRTNNFKAWLTTIARNLALNEYNKHKRETLYSPTDSIFLFSEESSSLPLEVIKALEVLSKIEYDIVIYHLVIGFKFREIASIFELSTSSVFGYYKNALKKLKKELE